MFLYFLSLFARLHSVELGVTSQMCFRDISKDVTYVYHSSAMETVHAHASVGMCGVCVCVYLRNTAGTTTTTTSARLRCCCVLRVNLRV